MNHDLQLRILTAIAWGIAFGWGMGSLIGTPPFGPTGLAVVLTIVTFWPKRWRRKQKHSCDWCRGNHPTKEHRGA